MQSKIKATGNIIALTPAKYTNQEEAKEMVAVIDQIMHSSKEKFSFLITIDDFDDSEFKARFILGEFLKSRKERVAKVAIISEPNFAVELSTKIVMTLAGFTKFTFFRDKISARKWLKGDGDPKKSKVV